MVNLIYGEVELEVRLLGLGAPCGLRLAHGEVVLLAFATRSRTVLVH